MQIKIGGEFKSIKPTGGKPYQYETKRVAERMLRICYPDHVRGFYGPGQTRVIEKHECYEDNQGMCHNRCGRILNKDSARSYFGDKAVDDMLRIENQNPTEV